MIKVDQNGDIRRDGRIVGHVWKVPDYDNGGHAGEWHATIGDPSEPDHRSAYAKTRKAAVEAVTS